MTSSAKSILTVLVALPHLLALPTFATEQEASKAKTGVSTLEEKLAAVLPKPSEEQWLKIPWQSDFAAARVEANREGKPLFLWMMNGNPLGCT